MMTRPALLILCVWSLIAATPAGPRSPAPAAAVADVEALRSDLHRLISATGWRGDAWSVLALSLDRKDTLYATGAERALIPASNMKLFTTAAALYYLGAEYRFSTFLLTDAPIEQGVLRGDLIVYGTGDPMLSGRSREGSPAVWSAFVDSLRALGVREIEGDVVGDGSYFTGAGSGTGWKTDYMNASYAAPAGALSINENLASVRVRPAAQAGWRPEVDVVPGRDGLAIVNQAVTVAGSRGSLDITRVAYDGPILIRGQIGRGQAGIWRAVPVPDPARFAAAVFREALEEKGITVRGGVRAVHTADASPLTGRSVFAPAFDDRPPVQVLAIHHSPPLLEVLDVINQRSHNFYAEQVLRTIGRVASGQGSAAGGAHATEYFLAREAGVDTTVFEMYDGSGLSSANRADARTVIQLLEYMADSPLYEAYFSTLPEAGTSRGLRRMQRTPAERNLRAKTGTIDRVSALSGYVRAANGERVAFSIISNNVPSTWRAKRVEDAIGARLASFTRPFEEVPLVGRADGERGAAEPAVVAGPTEEPDAAVAPPEPARASAPAESAPAASPREHTIGPGETLTAIARRYGTTVAALEDANPGLNPRRLLPGRTIRLPGGPSGPPENSSAPVAPQTGAPPPASAARSNASESVPTDRTHTIRRGDTLDGIAKRYGTTVAALQRANPGLNPRRLIPGKTVRIP